MTIFQACFAAAFVIFFLYLMLPERKKKPVEQSSRNARKNKATQVGRMTGFMGGDIEDALISRHALDRAHGDSANSTNRDVATSVAMQQAQQPPIE